MTELLVQWRAGDHEALDRLMPLVYDELRRRARRFMGRESHGHLLEPTALVNEAYLRLIDQSRANWQNRTQFFAIAAQVMRRILVDQARANRAEKRGGGAAPLRITQIESIAEEPSVDVLALDAALDELATLDGRQSRLVELRYFGGLTIEETADALGISPATVKREWAVARAWLHRQLKGK